MIRLPLLRRALLASAAVLVLPAAAQTAETTEVASNETVTVTATRSAKDVNDVPATVTVISDEDIADRLIKDIKDLVRFEPGVSVRAQPSRFGAALGSTGRDGNAGFNIRGLEGNRVLIQVDGVRIPDGYGFGPQVVGRGDFVDLDLLKTVEIVRGPASALYGSDGLAGSVSFQTKDPVDFLKGDGNFGFQGHAGYASANESWSTGGVIAGEAGAWSAMVAYNHRDWQETENKGANAALNNTRDVPNPEDGSSDSVLAKLVWTNDQHRIRLTYDRLESETSWDVITARAVPPLAGTSVLQLLANDDAKRDRITLDHRYEGSGAIRSADTNLYYQDATTTQFTFEDRNTAADRTRLNTFDNRVWGFGSVLQSEFTTGSVTHSLVYGVDFSKTHQDSIRTGTVPTPPVTFPERSFPVTDYTLLGAFVQDEIKLLDGALTLYPALRFDWFEIDPRKNDPLYLDPNVTGASDSHWSPKLGIVWKVSDEISLFTNLATGFKAPAPSQVNNFFSNLAFGYTSLPNPDLKPETSESIEGGIRYVVPGFQLSLTAFYGQYEDFISQQVVSGGGTPADPFVYQYVNLGSVEISGIEGRIAGDLGAGFSAIAAFSYSDGDDTTGPVDVPLATIDPFKVSAALNWEDDKGRFGAQLAAVHVSRKRASDTSCANAPSVPCTIFLPPSFTTLDLTAWVEITEGVRLRGGVFNITDETYWWWSDVQGVATTTAFKNLFTQPGRNYAVSLTVDF
ncbi:MAG: TonB-dependent hemoglobin/transferrin/lactoferrin family receptor [Micropepsaceae bacterium]